MIELKPDTEQKIKALAQKSGVSVDALLTSFVCSQALSISHGVGNGNGSVDKLAEFRTWVNQFSTPDVGLSDQGLSRGSIYER